MAFDCNKMFFLIQTKTKRRSSSTVLSKELIPCYYKAQVEVKHLNNVLLLLKLICLVRVGFRKELQTFEWFRSFLRCFSI